MKAPDADGTAIRQDTHVLEKWVANAALAILNEIAPRRAWPVNGAVVTSPTTPKRPQRPDALAVAERKQSGKQLHNF